MDDMGFDLKGFEELKENLASAIKKYPDLAEERLEDTAKKFKNRVIKITRSAVDRKTGNLIKGYKLDKLRGYGINMEKNFKATAPHFHLIEHGHEIITPKTKTVKTKRGKKKVNLKNGGQSKGWVPGRLIVKQARDEYSEIMPKVMQELIEDITRECGL